MGRYNVRPNGAKVDHNLGVGLGATIGEGAVVRSMMGGRAFANVTFEVPANAYVEAYRSPAGYSNAVFVVWPPDGRIMVKPGCQPLETIGRTIDRLVQPKACRGALYVSKAHRLAWLHLLTELATYTYRA